MKKMVDLANGNNKTLMYSREIPTKSMEISGLPFKKRNGEDVKWLRFELYSLQEGFEITVGSDDDASFLYYVVIDNETFGKI